MWIRNLLVVLVSFTTQAEVIRDLRITEGTVTPGYLPDGVLFGLEVSVSGRDFSFIDERISMDGGVTGQYLFAESELPAVAQTELFASLTDVGDWYPLPLQLSEFPDESLLEQGRTFRVLMADYVVESGKFRYTTPFTATFHFNVGRRVGGEIQGFQLLLRGSGTATVDWTSGQTSMLPVHYTYTFADIPEPGTAGLVLFALGGLAVARFRFRRTGA